MSDIIKNHWTQNLPDFGATSVVKYMIFEIDECEREIAALHQHLENRKAELDQYLLTAFSSEEIAQAKTQTR